MKKPFVKGWLPFCVIFILILAVDLRIALWGFYVYEHIRIEKDIVMQIDRLSRQPLSEINFEEVSSLSRQSAANLQGLKAQLEPLYPVLNYLSYAPVIGAYAAQVEPGIDFGLAASRLGDSLASSVLSFRQIFYRTDTNRQAGQELLYKAYLEAQPYLKQSETELQEVLKLRGSLETDLLSPEYAMEFDRLDQALILFKDNYDIVHYIPFLLGGNEPTNYLILVQNHDELRASGGFITAFGLVRMDQGKISIMTFEDSNSLNYVDKALLPPEPIHKIMMANYWVPRDGNWSPDFPTTARQVQSLYYSSTNYPTDVVVAFDQTFLVELLKVLGPTQLASDIPVVTSDNFETLMIGIKETARETMGNDQRKFFIGRLAPVILERMTDTRDFSQLLQLADLLQDQMRAGSFQMYINRPEIQHLLDKQQLSGKVDAGRGDFLMLVDSNIGFSKNDPLIERSIEYQINLHDPLSPVAHVSFKHKNKGVGNEACSELHSGNHSDDYTFPRCYWNYWRLYLAPGSLLVATDYQPNPASYFKDEFRWDKGVESSSGEGGTTLLGGLSVVPQQAERQVSFDVKLPATILQKDAGGNIHYLLRVQKQAGIDSIALALSIIPPQGYVLSTASVANSHQSSLISWEGYISRSGELEFVFEPDDAK